MQQPDVFDTVNVVLDLVPALPRFDVPRAGVLLGDTLAVNVNGVMGRFGDMRDGGCQDNRRDLVDATGLK